MDVAIRRTVYPMGVAICRTVYPMGVATLAGSAFRCWQLTWKKVNSRWCASVRFAGSFIFISS